MAIKSNKINNFAETQESLNQTIQTAICLAINEKIENGVSDRIEEFIEVVSDMIALYIKKNHDYGDSFAEAYKKFGKIYPLGRIHDKYGRLENLILKQEQYVNDESLTDTLEDLACYSVMFINAMNRNE